LTKASFALATSSARTTTVWMPRRRRSFFTACAIKPRMSCSGYFRPCTLFHQVQNLIKRLPVENRRQSRHHRDGIVEVTACAPAKFNWETTPWQSLTWMPGATRRPYPKALSGALPEHVSCLHPCHVTWLGRTSWS
jgi:hypothetical protein